MIQITNAYWKNFCVIQFKISKPFQNFNKLKALLLKSQNSSRFVEDCCVWGGGGGGLQLLGRGKVLNCQAKPQLIGQQQSHSQEHSHLFPHMYRFFSELYTPYGSQPDRQLQAQLQQDRYTYRHSQDISRHSQNIQAQLQQDRYTYRHSQDISRHSQDIQAQLQQDR